MIEGRRDCNQKSMSRNGGRGESFRSREAGEGWDYERGLPERPSKERARTLAADLAWEEGKGKSNKNVKCPVKENLLRSMTVRGRSLAESTLEQGQLAVIKRNIA